MTLDPIQRLLDEHAALQARFEPLRRVVRDLESGSQPSVDAAIPALRDVAYVMTTELLEHARREDEAFFPAVEEAMGGAFGPTTIMRQEHVAIHEGAERFRTTLRELHEVDHPAIVDGGERLRELVEVSRDAVRLGEIGGLLLDLIDGHFAKEEQILFPMSRQLLDAEALEAVARRMDALVPKRIV